MSIISQTKTDSSSVSLISNLRLYLLLSSNTVTLRQLCLPQKEKQNLEFTQQNQALKAHQLI